MTMEISISRRNTKNFLRNLAWKYQISGAPRIIIERIFTDWYFLSIFFNPSADEIRNILSGMSILFLEVTKSGSLKNVQGREAENLLSPWLLKFSSCSSILWTFYINSYASFLQFLLRLIFNLWIAPFQPKKCWLYRRFCACKVTSAPLFHSSSSRHG